MVQPLLEVLAEVSCSLQERKNQQCDGVMAQPWTFRVTTENVGGCLGNECVYTAWSSFPLSCFSYSSFFFPAWKQLKTGLHFFVFISWAEIPDDLKKGKLLSKVHAKCWTNAPQTHLAGEMFSRCTSERPPHVLVTSAFSVRVPSNHFSDLTVSQFPWEGLREWSNSLIVRKKKGVWSKAAKHRDFGLLTPL